nr:5-methyltetrahydropteroyltriglutamate--homocysteine S-methyltransferase [Lentibacillus salicampi]
MITQQSSLKRFNPPFRADHVGSLLRPDRLKKARQQRVNNTITQEQLRNIENQEIKRIVDKQKEMGLSAVTDGELRRSWWHFDFLENLDGVEAFDAEAGLQFRQQQTKARGIKVTDKIGFGHHPMLKDFKFLQSIAGSPVAKMTIPSPSMLRLRASFQEGVYNDPEAFTQDLADAYKQAIQAFYDAGCRYLQLDDTAWAFLASDDERERMRSQGTDPDDLIALYADTINKAVEDRPDDLTITMHICRGNYRSTWMYAGGYEPVAETLFDGVNVDGFFLEYDSDRAGDFKPLRFVKRKDLQIVLGLVTSKHPELEKADDVKQRVEEATQFVDLNQLCLSPQCGFASTEEGNMLTEEQQWAKLRHVTSIAQDIWK